MHILCHSCSMLIPAEDIDLSRRMAKCRRCQAVFGIADQLPADEIVRPAARVDGADPRPPSYVEIEEKGSDLAVRFRWRDASFPGTVFLCIVCAVWVGGLVYWYGGFFFAGGQVDWLGLATPAPFALFCTVFAYFTLCSALNSTSLEFGSGLLTIRHGPIPSMENHELEVRKIEQFFIHESEKRCGLSALMRDGTWVELMRFGDPALLGWLRIKLEAKRKSEERRAANDRAF